MSFCSEEIEIDLVCRGKLLPLGEKTRGLLVTDFACLLDCGLSLVSSLPLLPLLSWWESRGLVDGGDGRPLLPPAILDGEIGSFPPSFFRGERDSSIRAATDPRGIFDVSHCLFWCFS